MSRDPIDRYQPPAYDPNDARDVGTGSDFGADLWALYKAERLHFPELAAFCSGVTTSAHDAKQRVDFLRASTGGEYALTLVDNLRELLQVEMRQTSLALVVDAVDELIREQVSLRAQHHALPPENSTQGLLIVGAALLGAPAAIPTGGASTVTTGVVLASLAATTSEVLQVAAASVPADGGAETEFSAKTSDEFFHELSGRLEEILDNVRSQ